MLYTICKSRLCTLRILVLMSITLCAGGCLTASTVKATIGERANLSFVVVDPTPPDIRIFWRESPLYAETLLTFDVELPECTEVRLFANPRNRHPNELSNQPVKVRPLTVESTAEVELLQKHLPEDPCAVLLFAGEIQRRAFRGIRMVHPKFSRPSRGLPLSEDLAGETSAAFFVPFAFAADGVEMMIGTYPLLATGYVYRKAETASANPFTDEVRVVLSLADDNEYEFSGDVDATRNTLAQAPIELTGSIYAPLNLVPPEWATLSFWVRAALVEAGVDFRLQQVHSTPVFIDDLAETPWPELHITSIDGQPGPWKIHYGDPEKKVSDLNVLIEDAREIRIQRVEHILAPEAHGTVLMLVRGGDPATHERLGQLILALESAEPSLKLGLLRAAAQDINPTRSAELFKALSHQLIETSGKSGNWNLDVSVNDTSPIAGDFWRFDLQANSLIDAHGKTVALLEFLGALAENNDVRAYQWAPEGAPEAFYRFRRDSAYRRTFTPGEDAESDRDALERGAYFWWHEGLPENLRFGRLYAAEPSSDASP